MAAIDARISAGNELSGLRVRDVGDKLWMLEPKATPLLRLTSALGNKETPTDPKYEIYEHAPTAWWTTINSAAGFTTTVTTYKVTTSAIFRVGDTVWAPSTGMKGLITSIGDSTHITFTRTTIGTAAIATGAYLLRMGIAKTEGSTAGTPKMQQYTNVYNYTQIFRQEYGWTRTASKTKFFGGDMKKNRKMEAAFDIACAVERQFLFGDLYEGSPTGDNPQRTTGGFTYFVTTNVFNVAGVLTEDAFNRDILETMGRYLQAADDGLLLLAGPRLISVMESWGREKLRFNESKSGKLGFKIRNYESGHIPDLEIVRHPLFENDLIGWGLLVCKRHVGIREMDPIREYNNLHANDYDGELHEFRGELGFWISNEKKHGIIKNVTG